MSRLTGDDLDEARYMCDEPGDEDKNAGADDGYCPACNGSGEGQADGTRCSRCKGKGHAS